MRSSSFLKPKITPWEAGEVPTEVALGQFLKEEGLSYQPWSNGPHDLYPPHVHTYNKIIYVLRGSITFILPEEDQIITLNPGDRLELPAKIVHSAVVSSQGVTCFEAHCQEIIS